ELKYFFEWRTSSNWREVKADTRTAAGNRRRGIGRKRKKKTWESR
ncbi:hypothetical protein A2U01_0115550, partial [Trifolium medium]|nr:hypothetical protein [Trifolium medium]